MLSKYFSRLLSCSITLLKFFIPTGSYALIIAPDFNNNLMLSIIPNITGNYYDIKNNLKNGSIILIKNTKELNNIIEYINTKGYNIIPLSKLIVE